jgi:hypothetical protein
MADVTQTGDVREIAFEAYGVRLAVDAADEAVLERIRQFLPPGAQPCPPEAVECRFSLVRNRIGTYTINRNGKELLGTGNLDLDLALEMFDSQLRIYLGRTAPDAIFIHAGAVSHKGVAMVMPGMSFAGKTTLVAALVRAGAVYYSDEYAVIDRDGLVSPYAKALSIRADGWAQTDHSVESQGGVAGTERVPLGMIVITRYVAGAEWSPKVHSRGAGAMALLANAVPARERSKEVMEVISRAAEGAVVIESDRGDADAVAPLLLRELERHAEPLERPASSG